jgi:voltage-gated potassium channel
VVVEAETRSWFVRTLLRRQLTPRRAALAIALATVVVTLGAGALMRVLSPHDFSSVWIGLWWAVQTVTTVGYGDVVPRSTSGRIVAAVVMLVGIGFLTVVTASVTAALVESYRRRARSDDGRARLQARRDRSAPRADRERARRRTRLATPGRPDVQKPTRIGGA